MAEYISSTTKPTTDAQGNKRTDFILADGEYLLIQAIKELTSEIRRLANK